MQTNMVSMTKDQFINSACAYAASGLLDAYPEILKVLERQVKERVSTFSVIDSAVLLKAFAQAEAGGTETFYNVIEKHIGRNHNQVQSNELFAILRSF